MSHLFALKQIVNEPTHVHHDGSTSLIDLVFVSNPVLLNSCHVIPPLSNSDHRGILAQMFWRPTAKHNRNNYCKGRTVWCYGLADWEKACSLIEGFDWNSLLSDDINESWLNWSQKFMPIMNECIPKKKLPTCKNLPWLSKYRAIRNRVTSELRSAKRAYFQRLNPRNAKEFWKAVKYLSKQQSSIPTLVDDDNVEATSNSQKAEMFSKCFNPRKGCQAVVSVRDKSFFAKSKPLPSDDSEACLTSGQGRHM